jgi:RNA-binding protein
MSKIATKKRRRIKRKLCSEKPTVWIGKNGVTQENLKEIQTQLEREEAVKVRILQSALTNNETKHVASEIAEQTRAVLVEVRGHTFMLYKSRET